MADDDAARTGEPGDANSDAVDVDRGPVSEDASTVVDASETDAAADSDATETLVEDTADSKEATPRPRTSHVRLATIAGLVLVLALGGIVGWLGFRAYESHQLEAQRALFLQVGRQGALNLTTIDFEHVDDDVARVLDSATGTFYDDFQRRAQPFAEVVKQVRSKSVGTVTEAGLEETSGDSAQVLVAVTVNTSIADQPEQAPRAWRMRIAVQKVGDDEAKVSNVEFVQ